MLQFYQLRGFPFHLPIYSSLYCFPPYYYNSLLLQQQSPVHHFSIQVCHDVVGTDNSREFCIVLSRCIWYIWQLHWGSIFYSEVKMHITLYLSFLVMLVFLIQSSRWIYVNACFPIYLLILIFCMKPTNKSSATTAQRCKSCRVGDFHLKKERKENVSTRSKCLSNYRKSIQSTYLNCPLLLLLLCA